MQAAGASNPLPSETPPFVAGLIESGEILAYLHLTGNHVVSDLPQVGSRHVYETTLNVEQGVKVKFEYDVAGVFIGDADHLGKCVCYRPVHDPKRMIVAFRAVRINAAKVAGNMLDVESMLDPIFLQTTWMPNQARMSRGVCRHAGALWVMGDRGGLSEFLQDMPLDAIHFTGLSLAGALAQVTALRAVFDKATTTDDIREKSHVLTFGAIPWINGKGVEAYNRELGNKCAHIVTRLTHHAPAVTLGSPKPSAPWWTAIAKRVEGIFYDVVDPLTTTFSKEHAMLPHTYAIECPSRPFVQDTPELEALKPDDGFDFWSGGDGAQLGHLFDWTNVEGVVPRAALRGLMANSLGESHPLVVDYARLHRGRAYKAALLALVRHAVSAKAARERASAAEAEAPAPATTQASPVLAESTGARATMRRNSSKRTLEELLMADLTDAPSSMDENGGGVLSRSGSREGALERRPSYSSMGEGGGLKRRIASYGSLADKLDEIGMF